MQRGPNEKAGASENGLAKFLLYLSFERSRPAFPASATEFLICIKDARDP